MRHICRVLGENGDGKVGGDVPVVIVEINVAEDGADYVRAVWGD